MASATMGVVSQGNLTVDAGLSLVACAVMALLFGKPWKDTMRAEETTAPEPQIAG